MEGLGACIQVDPDAQGSEHANEYHCPDFMLNVIGALEGNVLKTNRIYVACEACDDLQYILQYAGEDNLVCGTDYGHTDQASELDALRELGKRTGVSQPVVDKILSDNPAALFGF